jgi:hypothetical protein
VRGHDKVESISIMNNNVIIILKEKRNKMKIYWGFRAGLDLALLYGFL